MRKFVLIAALTQMLPAVGAHAAQQIGDTRMHPVMNGCPAGMTLNAALNACVAVAPNGCCAPNPQRAVCAQAVPGQARWSGNPNDLRSGAAICPR